MSFFETWPHKWFALPSPGSTIERTTLADWVDEETDPQATRRVAHYLQAAPVVMAAQAANETCDICGSEIGNSSAWKSDGAWVWPEGLEHYVSSHAVRVPDSFYRHMAENDFTPNTEFSTPTAELHWPD